MCQPSMGSQVELLILQPAKDHALLSPSPQLSKLPPLHHDKAFQATSYRMRFNYGDTPSFWVSFFVSETHFISVLVSLARLFPEVLPSISCLLNSIGDIRTMGIRQTFPFFALFWSICAIFPIHACVSMAVSLAHVPFVCTCNVGEPFSIVQISPDSVYPGVTNRMATSCASNTLNDVFCQ